MTVTPNTTWSYPVRSHQCDFSLGFTPRDILFLGGLFPIFTFSHPGTSCARPPTVFLWSHSPCHSQMAGHRRVGLDLGLSQSFWSSLLSSANYHSWANPQVCRTSSPYTAFPHAVPSHPHHRHALQCVDHLAGSRMSVV